MRAAVAQGVLVSPVLFSLYINDIPTPSRHLVLAQYADGTAVIATSRRPSLLVDYLDTDLGRLELWLQDWRMAVDVWKTNAVHFVMAARGVEHPDKCCLSASQQSGSELFVILG
jgi:hypothetical protein